MSDRPSIDEAASWERELRTNVDLLPVAALCACRDLVESGEGGLEVVRSIVRDETCPEQSRASAAQILGARMDPEAIEKTGRLLRSRKPWVRFSAAAALRFAASEASIDALAAALDDEDEIGEMSYDLRVSDHAALALARIGGARARAALSGWYERRRREMEMSDRSLRDMAIYALARVRDAEAVARLGALVQSGQAYDQAHAVLLIVREGRDFEIMSF